jgi:alcohol dehydrogenase
VKAYVSAGNGRAELRDMEVPSPGHGEALIKVTTASICATDLKIIDGRLPVEPGRVIGHELVGEFVEGGAGVHGITAGERVFVHADTPCGACSECLGNPNGQGCQTGGSINAFHFGVLRDGGHAEYAIVPFAAANLVRIPDGVSDEQAVMLCCVGSTGVGGVERSGIRLGDTVAIVGQGPVGLSATVAAGLLGAAQIIAIDGMEDRLSRARRMGAHATVNPRQTDAVEEVRRLTDGRMADVAIEAVGIPDTFLTALRLTRPAGTLSSIGNYGISDAVLSLPLGIDEFMGGIDDKRIITTAAPGGKDRGRRLLAMAESGRLALDSYITHTFALEEIDAAIDLFRHKRDGVFKVAIKP